MLKRLLGVLAVACALLPGLAIAQVYPATAQNTAGANRDVSPVGVVSFPSSIMTASTFTTPAGTTAYASGDLVANSATAGSVTPLSFTACRVDAGSGMVRRVRVKTADTGFASQSVRVHLYRDSPTPSNGDNGAWLTTESNYIGALDVTFDRTFTDFVKGIGTPTSGTEINFDCASGVKVIYGVVEARSAATPQGAKAWTIVLEVLAN